MTNSTHTHPGVDIVRKGSVVYSLDFDGMTGDVTRALAICDNCGALDAEVPAQTWATSDESQPFVVDIVPAELDPHTCGSQPLYPWADYLDDIAAEG